MRIAGSLLAFLFLLPAAGAQSESPPAEIQRMIDAGMAEALSARLHDGRNAQEFHWLADAHRNRAKNVRDATQRQDAFAAAERFYLKWIEAVEHAGGDPARQTVDLASARAAYAAMIGSDWIAGDLDQYEVTNGQRGDRERLVDRLTSARDQYELVRRSLEPLWQELGAREDEFLALGVYDTIRQLRLDATFNLGWTNLYLGMVSADDADRRSTALQQARRCFRELLDSGDAGQSIYQCHLGLAMTLRELGEFDEAEHSFAGALHADAEAAVQAQARYELARCHVASGKFAEARTVLAPLVEKDLDHLTPEERRGRFYYYLARLWNANSYLAEGQRLQQSARENPASRKALLLQAQRLRETGLNRMNQLRRLGGPWPAVVQLYVAASVDTQAKLADLSPVELLLTAQQLGEAGQHEAALERLREAAARPDLEAEFAGQILFELGVCHYRLDDYGEAAQAFDRLARQHRGHEKAPQAATFAYQLWGELANQSHERADFGRLAEALLNLLQNYPQHEKRMEAVWLLPLALQNAGRYHDAVGQFGNVPAESPHWEEAQFRRVLCRRLACAARSDSASPEERVNEARQVAQELTDYAQETLGRTAQSTDAERLRGWAAEAYVNAAELLVAPAIAQYRQSLGVLEQLERDCPAHELAGRALATQIRAYRGLREYEQAAQTLTQYLQAVPADRAGPVLASLAQGMQEEVDRLYADGQTEAARRLAADSVQTFEELRQWAGSQADRADLAALATYGLARMHYVAGDYEQSAPLVRELLAQQPKNGNYRRLSALILTDSLSDKASPEQLQAAQDAWAALLKDPAIRRRAPQRYWEARYHWLALALRLGQAAEVVSAIEQSRVWYPDLGGEEWAERLSRLYDDARARAGLAPTTTQATPAGKE